MVTVTVLIKTKIKCISHEYVLRKQEKVTFTTSFEYCKIGFIQFTVCLYKNKFICVSKLKKNKNKSLRPLGLFL